MSRWQYVSPMLCLAVAFAATLYYPAWFMILAMTVTAFGAGASSAMIASRRAHEPLRRGETLTVRGTGSDPGEIGGPAPGRGPDGLTGLRE